MNNMKLIVVILNNEEHLDELPEISPKSTASRSVHLANKVSFLMRELLIAYKLPSEYVIGPSSIQDDVGSLPFPVVSIDPDAGFTTSSEQPLKIMSKSKQITIVIMYFSKIALEPIVRCPLYNFNPFY